MFIKDIDMVRMVLCRQNIPHDMSINTPNFSRYGLLNTTLESLFGHAAAGMMSPHHTIGYFSSTSGAMSICHLKFMFCYRTTVQYSVENGDWVMVHGVADSVVEKATVDHTHMACPCDEGPSVYSECFICVP